MQIRAKRDAASPTKVKGSCLQQRFSGGKTERENGNALHPCRAWRESATTNLFICRARTRSGMAGRLLRESVLSRPRMTVSPVTNLPPSSEPSARVQQGWRLPSQFPAAFCCCKLLKT